MRRSLTAIVIAALVGACSPAAPFTVELNARDFVPDTITIEEGATITFENKSREAHTVTAYEGDLPERARYFASGGFSNEADARAGVARGLLRPGETFAVTFQVRGTFRFFCIPHEREGMTGTVVVRPQEDLR